MKLWPPKSPGRVAVLACIAWLPWLAGCSDGEVGSPTIIQGGCQDDADCPAGFACDATVCVADVCQGDDCPCTADGDCPNGQSCDTDSGECFVPECLRNDDCGLGQLCVAGACQTDLAADRDLDGVPDAEDSCPELANADQENNDGDGEGDACDDDDDNDAVPDALDNCPTARNPLQGDADGDGLGNACDEDAAGIDVRGVLDYSAVPGADVARARVFISGRDEAVDINQDGAFVFDDGLNEPGRFQIRVRWPGFVPVVEEFTAPDGVGSVDLPTIVLERANAGDEAIDVRASALLDGAEDHRDIVVRARVGGTLVDTTLTDIDGSFALRLAPVDHTLTFSRDGFVEAAFTAVFNAQGEFEGRFTIDRVPLEEAPIVLSAVPTALVGGVLQSVLEVDDWPSRSLVTMVGEDVQRIATVSNDGPDGRFEIAGLRPGTYTLSAQVLGHLPVVQTLEVPVEGLTLDPIALTPIEVLFTASVTDGDAPLESVVVRARRGQVLADTTLSNEDGNFSLRLTPERHTLTLTRQGFQTHPTVTLDWDGRQFVVDSPLPGEPPFVLEANPVATVRAEVESSQGARNDWPNIAFVTLANGQERRIVGMDNAEGGRGQFQFVALPPGIYTLSITAQGHSPLSQEITLEEGDNALGLFELTAELDSDAAVLQGRVRLQGEDDQGGNHGGVQVRALVQGNTVITTQSVDDGVFAFQASRQDHTLIFSKTNYLPREQLIRWDEADERFELGGQPLSEALIELNLVAQSDLDFDGILDALDNCPRQANPGQENIDADGLGDACDNDADGDGMVNGLDNCPFSFNPMQEDLDGLGRGAACSLGTLEDPIPVGCGFVFQRLDLRERDNRLESSCGGAQSPEVVYDLNIKRGEVWQIEAQGRFDKVIYLLDERGREVDCVLGGRASFGGEGIPEGRYLLVIDGFGSLEASGRMEVNITPPPSCRSQLADAPLELLPGLRFHRVETADLDEDGHADIIALQGGGNNLDDRLKVLFGDGQRGFDRQLDLDLPDAVSDYALQVGDVNEDGHIDVLAGGNARLYVHLGDGQGNLGPATTFTAGNAPMTIQIGDVNEDGHVDVTVANRGFFSLAGQKTPSISILIGDGQGGFVARPPIQYPEAAKITHHILEDLNQDGHLDLCFVNFTNQLIVRLGDGQGGFPDEQSFPIGFQPSSIAVGDINRDTILDVAVPDSLNRTTTVFLGDGQGGMVPIATHPMGLAAMVLFEDIDEDGHLDLLTSNNAEQSVTVRRGDAQGNFQAPLFLPLSGNSIRMAATDLDGDTFRDLVVGRNNGITLLFGFRGEGQWQVPRDFVMDAFTADIGLADFNEDGLLDVITGQSNNRTLSMRLGDGLGGFDQRVEFSQGNHQPTAVALGDLNNDGHVDVVSATSGSFQNIAVRLGDGGGGLAPVRLTSTPSGSQMTTVALADVDRDGSMDVVAGDFGVTARAQRRVFVLPGNGQGGLGGALSFTVHDPVRDVEIEDINHDGHLDIIAAGREFRGTGIGGISVLLGDGQRGFTLLPSRVGPSGNAAGVAVGDINRDTHPDIAWRTFDGQIHVGQGDGQGNFTVTSHTIRQADGLDSNGAIRIFDLDGDRALDLLAINQDENLLYWLRGDGQGGFAPPLTFATGVGAEQFAVVHLDQDTLPDIVTANLNANSISVLQGRTRGGSLLRPHQAPQDSCPSTQVPMSQPGLFIPELDRPCRINRLEMAFDLQQGQTRGLRLTPASNRAVALPEVDPGVTRLLPENTPALAELESHALRGHWTLDPGGAPLQSGQATMIVNTYPDDPFVPETLAEACTAGEDQFAEVDFACRLPLTGLQDVPLANDEDEDVFLLEGDFDGAFIRGQTLAATVTTEPGAALLVELRAFRARGALAIADEVEPGRWALTFTIPPTYSGRYFSIHVRGSGVNDLRYDIDAGALD